MIPDMILHIIWQQAMIYMTMNLCYDSRHDFNTSLNIIAMIHMTGNHGYDSSHDFHTPQNIMVMI